MKVKICSHLEELNEIKSPESYECSECVKTNDTWMHLRCCQTCGVVLCCDSSPNKHASTHAKEHNHQVIISAEPEERWAWCYEDEKILRY